MTKLTNATIIGTSETKLDSTVLNSKFETKIVMRRAFAQLQKR